MTDVQIADAHRHQFQWDFPECQECGGEMTCAICGERTRVDGYIADVEAEVERLRAENARLSETLQGTQNMLGIILQTFPDVRAVCEQLISEMAAQPATGAAAAEGEGSAEG